MEWLVGKAASLAKLHKFNEAISSLHYAYRLGELEPNTLMILVEPMVDYIAHKASKIVNAFRKKDIDPFFCGVCLGLIFEPVTISCGHSYCKECLKEVRRLQTCQICNAHHSSLKLCKLEVNVNIKECFEKYFPSEMEARRLKQEGNKLFKNGHCQEALLRYTATIQLDPYDHLSLSNRSHVYASMNLLENALKDAELVCQLQPTWPKGYFRKGAALLKLGQCDEAFLAYLQCLTLDPSVTSAKEAIAEIMFKLLVQHPQVSKKCKCSDSSHLHMEPDNSSLTERIAMVIKFLVDQEKLDSKPGLPDSHETRCSDVDPEVKVDGKQDTVTGSRMNKKKSIEIKKGLICTEDYECSLCFRLYYHPVTTPCGHTFCKACLYRSLDYNNSCPLCKRSLAEFLSNRCKAETTVIGDIIRKYLPTEFQARQAQQYAEWDLFSQSVRGTMTEEIPIFVQIQAYPTIPCPLDVFEPRYRLMIRLCVESGSMQFGMCYPTEDCFSKFGVMLQIREVRHLPDGHCIIDSVGGRRFRVLEQGMKDGYNTAKVEFIVDIRVEGKLLEQLHALHDTVYDMAVTWYTNRLISHKVCIKHRFGTMPEKEVDIQENHSGPRWIWWLTAVLPNDDKTKQCIVSTTSLHLRLLMLKATFTRIVQR